MDASIVAEFFEADITFSTEESGRRRLAGINGIPIWFIIPVAVIVSCCLGRMVWNLYKKYKQGKVKDEDEDGLLTSKTLPYEDWRLEEMAATRSNSMKDLSKKRDSHVDDFIHDITGSNWVEQWDSNHQCTYYWNKITHESTWEKPDGFESKTDLGLTEEEQMMLRQQTRNKTEVDNINLSYYEPADRYSRFGSFKDLGDEENGEYKSLIRNVGGPPIFEESEYVDDEASNYDDRSQRYSEDVMRYQLEAPTPADTSLEVMLASMKPDRGSFTKAGRGGSSSWMKTSFASHDDYDDFEITPLQKKKTAVLAKLKKEFMEEDKQEKTRRAVEIGELEDNEDDVSQEPVIQMKIATDLAVILAPDIHLFEDQGIDILVVDPESHEKNESFFITHDEPINMGGTSEEITFDDKLAAREYVKKMRVHSWSVTGHRISEGKKGDIADPNAGPAPDSDVCVVDEAILSSFQPPKGPLHAKEGSANQRLYQWMGINKMDKFPKAVIQGMKKKTDTVFMDYALPSKSRIPIKAKSNKKKAHVIHVATDKKFKAVMEGDKEKHAAQLASAYFKVFKTFLSSECTSLRLVPIGGNVINPEKHRQERSDLPFETWTAIQDAYTQLDEEERKDLNKRDVFMCVERLEEVPGYGDAGFIVEEIAPKVVKKRPPEPQQAEELDFVEDAGGLLDSVDDQSLSIIEARDTPLMMPGTEPEMEEEIIFKEDVILDTVDYSLNMEQGPPEPPPEPDHPHMEDSGHIGGAHAPAEIGVTDAPINMEEPPTEMPPLDSDDEIIEEEEIIEEVIEVRRVSMEDPPSERYKPDDPEDVEHLHDQGAVSAKPRDSQAKAVDIPMNMEEEPSVVPSTGERRLSGKEVAQRRASLKDQPDRRSSDSSRRVSMEDPPSERYDGLESTEAVEEVFEERTIPSSRKMSVRNAGTGRDNDDDPLVDNFGDLDDQTGGVTDGPGRRRKSTRAKDASMNMEEQQLDDNFGDLDDQTGGVTDGPGHRGSATQAIDAGMTMESTEVVESIIEESTMVETEIMDSGMIMEAPFEALEDGHSFHGDAVVESGQATATSDAGMILEEAPFEALEDGHSFHGDAVVESGHATATSDAGMILEEAPMVFDDLDDQGFHGGLHHDEDHHHAHVAQDHHMDFGEEEVEITETTEELEIEFEHHERRDSHHERKLVQDAAHAAEEEEIRRIEEEAAAAHKALEDMKMKHAEMQLARQAAEAEHAEHEAESLALEIAHAEKRESLMKTQESQQEILEEVQEDFEHFDDQGIMEHQGTGQNMHSVDQGFETMEEVQEDFEHVDDQGDMKHGDHHHRISSVDTPMRMSIDEQSMVTVDFGEASVGGNDMDEEDDYDAALDDGTEMLNLKADKEKCFGSYKDGVDFSQLKKADFIGEGSFGKVFGCTYFGFKTAMKDYAKAGGGVAITRDALSELTKQAEWHYSLQCAFITPLIALNVDQKLGAFCMIMPRASCSLFELLHNPHLGEMTETVKPGEHSGSTGPDPALLRKLPLNMKQRLTWLRQISMGMKVIHENNSNHLGLSSRNILLQSEYDEPGPEPTSRSAMQRPLKFAGKRGVIAQVSDFGVRRMKKLALKNSTGNHFLSASGKQIDLEELAIPWMAPEMIDGGSGLQASDVYSFHVLMYEIITGSPPHIEKDFEEVIQFSRAKMKLELPSDEDLNERWEEILSRQSRRSHGHVATTADSNHVLASDRVAHKPLPAGFRELYDKCCARNPAARPSFIQISDALANMLTNLEAEVELEPVILESTLKATQDAEKNNALMKSKTRRQRPSMSLAKGLSTTLLDEEGEEQEEGEITLEEMCSVPVVFVNAESGRKLFAQEINKGWDLMGNGFTRGFGAGPEAHTFDDNKWWLLPQMDQKKLSFVIENAHSGRRLYAQDFQNGNQARPEKGIGAHKPERGEGVSSETRWSLEPVRVKGKPTTYIIRNASYSRALFARVPKQGEKWHVGMGAAALGDPRLRGKRNVPLSMQWTLVPQWSMSKDFPKSEGLVDVMGGGGGGGEERKKSPSRPRPQPRGRKSRDSRGSETEPVSPAPPTPPPAALAAEEEQEEVVEEQEEEDQNEGTGEGAPKGPGFFRRVGAGVKKAAGRGVGAAKNAGRGRPQPKGRTRSKDNV